MLGTRRALTQQAEETRRLEAHVKELEAENRRLEEHQRGLAELETYARSVEAESSELRRQLDQRRVRAGIALGRFADRLRLHRAP